MPHNKTWSSRLTLVNMWTLLVLSIYSIEGVRSHCIVKSALVQPPVRGLVSFDQLRKPGCIGKATNIMVPIIPSGLATRLLDASVGKRH